MSEANQDTAEKSIPKNNKVKALHFWSSTISAVLVGGVFVFAGLLKILDPFSFYTQIHSYQLVSPDLSKWLAVVLPPIEIGLGLAVMLGLWRRLSCLGIVLMLVVFLVATGHAWLYGTTDNCGCFGELVSRSPKETFIEDVVLLILAAAGMLEKSHFAKIGRFRIHPWMKLVGVLLLMVASAVTSVLSGGLNITTKGKLKKGLDASAWPIKELDTPAYEKKGATLNLKKGTHVLVVYSPLCKYCYQEIPEVAKMAKLFQKKGLATVAGLSHDLHRDKFFRIFVNEMKNKGAEYPLFTMPYEFYRNLNRSVPKTVIIKTGVVRYVIKGIPETDKLLQFL